MGCCSSKSNSPSLREKPKKPQCTDVVCSIFFLVFLCGYATIIIYIHDTGAIYGTYNGWDSYGNACGFNNTKSTIVDENYRQDNTNKKFRMCLNYENLFGTVTDTTDDTVCFCVEACPKREHFQKVFGHTDQTQNEKDFNYNIRLKDKDKFKTLETVVYNDLAESLQNPSGPGKVAYCVDFPKPANRDDIASYGAKNQCPMFSEESDEDESIIIQPTLDILNRCVPADSLNALKTVGSFFIHLDFIQSSVYAIYEVRFHIIIALSLATVASLILTLLLRYIAGVAAWIITIGSSIVMALLAVGLWVLYGYGNFLKELSGHDGQNTTDASGEAFFDAPDTLKEQDNNLLLVLAIIATVASVLMISCVACMKERTEITVACMKEGSKTLTRTPLLFLVPVFTMVILLVFWTFWALTFITVTSRHISINEKEQSKTIKRSLVSDSTENFVTGRVVEIKSKQTKSWKSSKFEDVLRDAEINNNSVFKPVEEYLGVAANFFTWYVLFAVVWITEFIISCSYLVIAGATASVFSRNMYKANPENSQSWFTKYCSILSAFSQLVIYHLGTAAFGSFIISLVQVPRAILAYIQAKVVGKENTVASCVLCCIQCCLTCFEKCLRSITSTAYVIVMVDYSGFCTSAIKCTELILGNSLQTISLESLSWGMTFLSQILIAAGASLYMVYNSNQGRATFQDLLNGFKNGTNTTFPDTKVTRLLEDGGHVKEGIMNGDELITVSDKIYQALPIIVVFIASYCIAKSFFCLYDMVLRTTLIMYLKSKEEGYYAEDMPEGLRGHFEELETFVDTLLRGRRNQIYETDDYPYTQPVVYNYNPGQPMGNMGRGGHRV